MPNRRIKLAIWVDDMGKYETYFQVCYIPNSCDLLIGIPWNRTMKPFIDWNTDRIYNEEELLEGIRRTGKLPEYRESQQQHEFSKRNYTTEKHGTRMSKSISVLQTCKPKAFHYSRCHGTTKVISYRNATRLIRKDKVEFIIVLQLHGSVNFATIYKANQTGLAQQISKLNCRQRRR